MNAAGLSAETTPRVRLKDGVTFFAAGDSFDLASSRLSDGSFKLFAHLRVRADRQTGQYEVTLKQLAASLKKSGRIVGRYAIEVRAKGVCKIRMGSNQFARIVFEVCEDYWPYVREGHSPLPLPDHDRGGDGSASVDDGAVQLTTDLGPVRYIETVRHTYIALGCARGIFRLADGSHRPKLLQPWYSPASRYRRACRRRRPEVCILAQWGHRRSDCQPEVL